MKDPVGQFRMAYLDYVEGLVKEMPSMDHLTDVDRGRVEKWVASVKTAREIGPIPERPSTADLMQRVQELRTLRVINGGKE